MRSCVALARARRNADLEPGGEGQRHRSAQDELYFVHAGTPEIEIEGVVHPLRPGSVSTRPGRPRARSCAINGDGRLRSSVIVGASGGYVGRDGTPAEDGTAPGASG